MSISYSLADGQHLHDSGRQHVIVQSGALCVCMCVCVSFFSPKPVISGFDHSFQIQTPNVKYLYAAACVSWFREKNPHKEK